MRQLTATQKKLLDKVWIEYQPECVQDLDPADWDKLVKLNDTEILWQEVNRYLSDKLFALTNK